MRSVPLSKCMLSQTSPPIIIWSYVVDSLNAPKLQNWIFPRKSVTYFSIDSFWTQFLKTYLLYSSYCLGVHCSSKCCHDYVELIVLVLCEDQRVVQSTAYLPLGIALQTAGYHIQLKILLTFPVNLNTSGWCTKFIFTPSLLGYFSCYHVLMRCSFCHCQIFTAHANQLVPPFAKIDHYILIYHQRHFLMVWPNIKQLVTYKEIKNVVANLLFS